MQYKIKDVVAPAVSADVVLGSMSGKISATFFQERIFSDFAKTVVYQEAEDAFANQVDDAKFVGVWQGEFWGKWIISAAEVCKMTGDAELKTFLVNAAHKLLTYAREDGYLNTYKNSLNVFRVDPKEAKAKCNKSVDWNWNIWCRKYTLWGLISVYEVTGDEESLQGARRLMDQLMSELEANGIELRKTGTFVGMPSCSILKPLLLLYRYTDEKKYLDYAIHEIADNWEREDNACPNLISNAISGKRLTDWYENSPSWAKAYEMMSCFEGICELYRHTGNARYLQAAEGVYEILKKYELNPAFSVAYNDVFADAAGDINLISEPCDAIHWMRLCYELFCLTGKVKYMDSIELTYYNAFLAGVFNDGKWGARGVRGTGSHMWAEKQADMQHQHCCVNNMPRAFTRIAECAVMQTEDAVLVNLYEAVKSTVSYEGGSVSVQIEPGYFRDGKVEVSLTYLGKRKPVRFRVPAWSDCAELTVNGVTCSMLGGWFTLADVTDCTNVCLDFHSKLALRRFDKPVAQYTERVNDKPHWKVLRWINPKQPGQVEEDLFLREARCTLTYGPLLLARSKKVGNTEQEMFEDAPVDADSQAEVVSVRESGEPVRLMMDVQLGDRIITVCDYASAANQKLEDNRFFSIYF